MLTYVYMCTHVHGTGIHVLCKHATLAQSIIHVHCTSTHTHTHALHTHACAVHRVVPAIYTGCSHSMALWPSISRRSAWACECRGDINRPRDNRTGHSDQTLIIHVRRAYPKQIFHCSFSLPGIPPPGSPPLPSPPPSPAPRPLPGQ